MIIMAGGSVLFSTNSNSRGTVQQEVRTRINATPDYLFTALNIIWCEPSHKTDQGTTYNFFFLNENAHDFFYYFQHSNSLQC